jgi:hypothetical protein
MYRWLFPVLLLVALVIACSLNEPCDCPENDAKPQPELSLVPSDDPCMCGPSDIPTYDYWLFTSACDNHDVIQMEGVREKLDSCFDAVNQQLLQDVLASCYKIRQLCHEADMLMKQRLECIGKSRERMNAIKNAFAGCNSAACLSLYRMLVDRERQLMHECVDYYVNESLERRATIDSLYALFPGKIRNYENQAKDCIEEAKRQIAEKGIKCVERLELNIIIDE